MQKIYINRIKTHTRVEGFGQRYCIWVQGCSIRCLGCANKEMWEFGRSPVYDTESIIEDILLYKDDIEGITIMGGEPFDQALAVLDIVRAVKKEGLTVMVFTGYIYEDLVKKNEDIIKKIMHFSDVIIDGPYELEKKDYTRPWVGSKNQRYIFLSECYQEKDLANVKNKCEIKISSNGIVEINGMADYVILKELLEV